MVWQFLVVWLIGNIRGSADIVGFDFMRGLTGRALAQHARMPDSGHGLTHLLAYNEYYHHKLWGTCPPYRCFYLSEGVFMLTS
jgi:hypothetical protein